MTQELLNQIMQMKFDRIKHQMYGTVYLQKPDGSIVLRYPDGTEGPLPTYYGDADEL